MFSLRSMSAEVEAMTIDAACKSNLLARCLAMPLVCMATITSAADYDWVLADIRWGHTYLGSLEISYQHVESDLSSITGPSGTLRVKSKGYLRNDGGDCTDRYEFSWNLGGNYLRIPADGSSLKVDISATGRGDGDLSELPAGQCPGSNDGGFSAGGNLGVFRPRFLEANEWDEGLPTTGRSDGIYGYSTFYPNAASVDIVFPAYQPGYSNTAFAMFAGVGNPNASAVFEYAIAYLYIAVRSGRKPLEDAIWIRKKIKKEHGGNAEYCVRNNTAKTQKIEASVAFRQKTKPDTYRVFNRRTFYASLAPDQRKCFEFRLQPNIASVGEAELVGWALAFSEEARLPRSNDRDHDEEQMEFTLTNQRQQFQVVEGLPSAESIINSILKPQSSSK